MPWFWGRRRIVTPTSPDAPSIGRRNPRIVYLAREQAFNITVNGLLPLTYHYLFYEGDKVDTDLYKPLGGKLADPLISDRDGKLSFVYYFTSNLPEYTTELTEYYTFINNLAGRKELVIANITDETLPSNYQTTAFSYAVTYITIEAFRPTQQEFEAGYGER